ncbi:MAG: HemK2/MTQ2 family protein methyltransferase [Candidatus Methanomethylophilaceae archaeon]|jgi:release factor glutamine methyltransferase
MKYDPAINIAEADDVYPPSEDSIMLIQSFDVEPPESVLEIGCGSGIVAIHCAHSGADVVAVDINPHAVELTGKNAEANGVKVDARGSDLFQNVPEKFDTIVFNLPYLPVSDEGELAKAWSGGEDGMGPLPRLVAEAPDHLNMNGRLIIVVSSLMDQEKLDALLDDHYVNELSELPLFFEKLKVLEIHLN